jgi:hypothetical protein
MINWHQYNEKLVRRSEIIISLDCINNWVKELAEMNDKKRAESFSSPTSFIND